MNAVRYHLVLDDDLGRPFLHEVSEAEFRRASGLCEPDLDKYEWLDMEDDDDDDEEEDDGYDGFPSERQADALRLVGHLVADLDHAANVLLPLLEEQLREDGEPSEATREDLERLLDDSHDLCVGLARQVRGLDAADALPRAEVGADD